MKSKSGQKYRRLFNGGGIKMAELRKEDLWVMADKLRNNMDSAEYKHICLGLIFL